MKYLHACQKGNKYLIKLETDEGKQVWAETSKAVVSYASNNFKQNDEADFEYTKDNKGQYHVTRINKGGKSVQKPAETHKASTPKNSTPKSYGKSPEDREAIKRQAMMKASCEAVKTLTGQIGNADTLGDTIIALYERFMKKINE